MVTLKLKYTTENLEKVVEMIEDALLAHKGSFSSNHTKACKVFYKFV